MKRLLSITFIALAIIALVAAAGCSSSTPPTATTTSPPTTPATSTAPSADKPATAVSIVNMAFSPDQLTVQVGDTVTWTNNDSVPHTVTGADFDSGAMATGATYSYTFVKAGTFDYTCTIHPQMLARVTVQ
jgi:plastocyanin